jgi:uncharacterized damage-inducible protein DinB
VTQPERRLLEPLPEFESQEIALFVAQLDERSRHLLECIQGATDAELAWQPTPGMNTAGMLLAHLAIVEVFWTSVLAEAAFLCEQVLGIRGEDDGMPLAAGDPAPAVLAGKNLAFYENLLARARRNTLRVARDLASDVLTREIEQRRRGGTVMLNGRWILHHLVEHGGVHGGQIALLRHLYRSRTP